MHDRIERVTGQITAVSLVAAALLLAPGLAGVTPSLPLVAGTLALGVAAFAGRDWLDERVDVVRAPHLDVLWIGPLVAALVLLWFSSATADELQTLGSVVGLIGMFNYLLRPVYYALGTVAERVVRTT